MYAIIIPAPGHHADPARVLEIVAGGQVVRTGPAQVAHYVPGSTTDECAWALGAAVPHASDMGKPDLGPSSAARVPV